jgi:predicted DNA-binding transcriptional regulator AlpA
MAGTPTAEPGGPGPRLNEPKRRSTTETENSIAKPGADDALLHSRDAAKVLSVSSSWLAKARLAGNGPRYTKIGRAVRYPKSSLREFIKSRMRGSTSEV